jgi:hypothetical protein
LLSNGQVVEITSFEENNLGAGRLFISPRSFFTDPLDSMKVLGICVVSQQESDTTVFPLSDVVTKFYRIPLNGAYIMMPVLHSIIN